MFSFWPHPNLAPRMSQEGLGPISSRAKMKLLSTHVSILAPLILTRNYFENIFFIGLGPNICGARLQNILGNICNLAQVILAPKKLWNFGAKFSRGQIANNINHHCRFGPILFWPQRGQIYLGPKWEVTVILTTKYFKIRIIYNLNYIWHTSVCR